MHPNYTGRDMAIMEQEFERDFEKKFNDPIAAFIDHHAVRLGILNPDEAGKTIFFIKLPFVIKIFVLSIFEWPFYTGFTVHGPNFF